MSPRDQKKRIGALAEKIRQGETFSTQEQEWLGRALNEISEGRDPKEALGVKHGRGQSNTDEDTRAKLSLIMHWIAGAIEPGEGEMTLEKAFEAAEPLARKLFNNKTGTGYDAAYLRQAWYRHTHMQNPIRKTFDPDTPY
jgi:hypothetical protein